MLLVPNSEAKQLVLLSETCLIALQKGCFRIIITAFLPRKTVQTVF
jgi:hypothetical protein